MRAMPLLLLVAVPFLVAAPVPKSRPTAVTSYSADELAKLPFVDPVRVPDDQESSEARKAKSVAVAVHLPRTRFEEGDPIPVLFVLKNRADKPHGLWMGFDFAGRTAYGSSSIDVRNTATDTVSSPFAGQATMCGGPRWAIPANGYFAVRGNVGRLGTGEPLPAGEYELTWAYAGTKSKAVNFTVVSRRLGRPQPAPQRGLRLSRVQSGEEDEPLAWTRAEVAITPDAELTHALGTGGFGAYFPCARELPSVAGGLRAVATWEGDIVTLTLDSPHQEFTELGGRSPVVYLLIERAVVAEEDDARAAEKQGERKASAADVNTLPLKLAIRLPRGWKDTTGASGDCQVSVVVASREPPVFLAPDGVIKRVREIERNQKVIRTQVEVKNLPSKPKTGDWVLKTEWQPLPKTAPK